MEYGSPRLGMAPGRGFEEHSSSWSCAPAPPGPPLLSIPEEMTRPIASVSTDDTLNLLKQKMLGLTQMVKSLSSQISDSSKSKWLPLRTKKPELSRIVPR